MDASVEARAAPPAERALVLIANRLIRPGTRSHKDGNEWKDSASFAFDELMVLAKAIFDAHTKVAAPCGSELEPVAA